MGKRKLPFGYALENGDVKAEAKESGCVNWIYMTYHAGASLQEIASELNARASVHYDTDKPWNKNMVDRILQDQRYSGDAPTPESGTARCLETDRGAENDPYPRRRESGRNC